MHIIFDFDGTLADTEHAIVDYLAKRYPSADLSVLRQRGLREFFERHGIGEFQMRIGMFLYKRWLRRHINEVRAFPLKEVLRELARHHTLGIVSSNSKRNIRTFLRKEDIWQYFRFIHADSSLFGKDEILRRMVDHYHLDPKEIIYIADEDRDIVAAKKAGMVTVAVTWGYNSRTLLKKHHPDHIVDKPEEILKIFRNRRAFAKGKNLGKLIQSRR